MFVYTKNIKKLIMGSARKLAINKVFCLSILNFLEPILYLPDSTFSFDRKSSFIIHSNRSFLHLLITFRPFVFLHRYYDTDSAYISTPKTD